MKYLKNIITIIILTTLTTLSTQAQSLVFEYDAAGNMIKRMQGVPCLIGITTIPPNFPDGLTLQPYTRRGGKITTTCTDDPNKKVDVVVREDERVEFRGDNIELKPGFKVEGNATFKAVIDPCCE